MQIHELNLLNRLPESTDFLAIDTGYDTAKIPANELFADSATVGQAVSDWLDDHPEATTTVQDGSLTDAKFSAALKLETINEYVTPEMYGAVGDGTTDDSDAFELALNSGKPVFVPGNSYYIGRTLNNPAAFTLVGSGRRTTSIKLGDSLLANAATHCVIADIYFYCNIGSSFYVFPAKLNGSMITRCDFLHFDKIFYRLETCCMITDNWFRDISVNFCYQCVDSFVTGNYFSGASSKNPQSVVFDNSCSSSVISNNFFCYFYKIFAVVSTMSNLSVTGNVFMVCYCVFYNHIDGTTFVGNTIMNFTKQSGWDVSDNNDMNTKSWAVIKRTADSSVLRSWTSSVLSNNTIINADMYMDCEDMTRYPTYSFLVDEHIDPSLIKFGAQQSGIVGDYTNVMIRPMLKRTVSSLPSPNITGNNLVSFNHDEVIYNDKLYININGAWKQATS